MFKYLILIPFILTGKALFAQTTWQSKGVLYSDKNIAVEVEYLMASNGCASENNVSYYRYRITRINKVRDYYINWRYDFFNCNNELKTKLNSIYIDKNIKLGPFIPEDNSFIVKQLANNFNDVRKSNMLPSIGSYQPASVFSMEPISIEGNRELNYGDTAAFTLKGGYLTKGATWKWYDQSCGGTIIGTGPTLKFIAKRSGNVFVRAVSEHSTNCISVSINVNEKSVAAASIQGRSEICEGEQNITLTVNGGRLFGNARWVWYANDCNSEPIGNGSAINVTPVKTTIYFVRAEDDQDKTDCKSLQVRVTNKSVKPTLIETSTNSDGRNLINFSVVGGYLSLGSQWVWYIKKGVDKVEIGKGSSIKYNFITSNETFYVRAEGKCHMTEFVSKTISIQKTPIVHQEYKKGKEGRSFFFNAGAISQDVSEINNINNFLVTIGGGGKLGWFARAKFTTTSAKAQFETSNTQISNYNSPGFYQYNGGFINKRVGYSAGIHFGGYKLSGYIGAGYGTRELLWSINQYNYNNSSQISSAYAKNIDNSFKGAEIEAGLLIRIGFLNIMGGASSIQFKYTDFNLGVGFNL